MITEVLCFLYHFPYLSEALAYFLSQGDQVCELYHKTAGLGVLWSQGD
jgi:hypothetical protein